VSFHNHWRAEEEEERKKKEKLKTNKRVICSVETKFPFRTKEKLLFSQICHIH